MFYSDHSVSLCHVCAFLLLWNSMHSKQLPYVTVTVGHGSSNHAVGLLIIFFTLHTLTE